MPLTHLSVTKAKPREDGKPLKLADSGGLYLWVMGSGAKYWRFKYRWADKEKLLALGVYPEILLKDARERRDAARRLLADNIDPGEKRRSDRLASRRSAAASFEAIALEWHKAKATEWAPRHAQSVLSSLQTHLFPQLGKRPIADIEPLELLELLRKIESDGKRDTAKRLRERGESIFRLAIVTGRAKHNAAADLAEGLQANIPKPHAALTQQELPIFLRRFADSDTMTLHTRVIFKIVMTCFTRIGETVRAEWEHIDLAAGLWTIPPENRKLRHKLKAASPAHIVPLPSQIIEDLRSLLPLSTTNNPYIFPNVRSKNTHMSEATPLKALERMGYGGKNKENGYVVTHGFRATASTILNESGFNPDAVERQLSHVEPNQVRAAYNRAQYLEERLKMLQCWADYLDALSSLGKPLPLSVNASSTPIAAKHP